MTDDTQPASPARCPESRARVSPARGQIMMVCWTCGAKVDLYEERRWDWAMADHDAPAPVTDEQVGRALRVIASRCAPLRPGGEWQWYARALLRDADTLAESTEPRGIRRTQIIIHPTDRIDGMLERLVELVTGVPCSVIGGDPKKDPRCGV